MALAGASSTARDLSQYGTSPETPSSYPTPGGDFGVDGHEAITPAGLVNLRNPAQEGKVLDLSSLDSGASFDPTETPADLRKTNRELRKQVPDADFDLLKSERHTLVLKKHRSGLTKKERLRLQLLDWQVAGIEEARIGDHLDKLDLLVDLQEKVASDVEAFASAVAGASAPRGNPRYRKLK